MAGKVTRRSVFGAIGSGLLASAATAAPAGNDRPNVLVIVLDDLGCHDLGFLGAADLKTPHIDALAHGGARFPHWYSNAPVCAPARASILSGRYPANAGVARNGADMTAGIPTIASILKGAGYRTGAFGKWHLGSTDRTCPNGQGFESFYGFHSGCVDFFSHRYYWGEPRVTNYHDLWRNRTEIFEDGRYLTERITEEAVAFLRGSATHPFFGYIAFNAPHYPMHAPAKYLERFSGLTPERRVYAAMIAAVDDGIGAIRNALEDTGQFDNTLIFLVGDNGATTEKRAGLNQQYATAGDNGIFKGFKFSLFDGGMHVPALVSWPARVRKGTVVQERVMSMDILPTICRAAGIRVPQAVDGSDVLDVITAGAKSPHDALYWSSQEQLAVIQGRWKLVLNGRLWDRRPEGGQPLQGDDAVWLSDIQADPGETRNLRHQHPAVVDELTTQVQRWSQSLRE